MRYCWRPPLAVRSAAARPYLQPLRKAAAAKQHAGDWIMGPSGALVPSPRAAGGRDSRPRSQQAAARWLARLERAPHRSPRTLSAPAAPPSGQTGEGALAAANCGKPAVDLPLACRAGQGRPLGCGVWGGRSQELRGCVQSGGCCCWRHRQQQGKQQGKHGQFVLQVTRGACGKRSGQRRLVDRLLTSARVLCTWLICGPLARLVPVTSICGTLPGATAGGRRARRGAPSSSRRRWGAC